MQRVIKTRDILNCHSPLLTCILICEFTKQVGESSVRHQSLCSKLTADLTSFCKNIQDSNPNEKYIKFIMTQKDLRGRTVFQIAAENSFYLVLQTPEIGTIVKKMWNGRLVYDSFVYSSSLYRFLEDSSMRLADPFNHFEEREISKSYFYQFSLWKESCSMRYWPESISTICLIVIYNLYIYFLVNSNQIMFKYTDLDSRIKFLLYLYIGWTWCINYNIFNQFLFCKLVKRKFIIDLWGTLEIFLSIFSLLLLVDTNDIFGVYEQTNKEKNLIKSDEMSDFPFIFRGVILSINDILVWMRITGILLTFKVIGPLIRMISLLSMQTAKYLIVYCLYITCFVGIFTAIFYNTSEQFSSFSITFTTLFGGFINNMDAFSFTKHQFFGAIFLIFYVTISGIMLINLLISHLSNVYRSLSLQVDASHRSVLISYHRRYKWNNEYGFMLLLTTPINIINLLVVPIFLLFKKYSYNIELLNSKISQIYYMVFYFPFMILSTFFFNLTLIPISYLKGIFNTLMLEKQSKRAYTTKFFNLLFWIICGNFSLFIVVIKDVYYLFESIFNSFDLVSSEKDRIRKYIIDDDVIMFLQFIHGRSKEDQNDLHTLFIDFLLFEQEKKAERDALIKEKSYYIEKINNAAQRNSKSKAKRTSSAYFMASKSRMEQINRRSENTGYRNSINNLRLFGPNHNFPHKSIRNANNSNSNISNNSSGSKKPPEKVSGTFVNRNIIIIEILENFLIDDGSDNYIVDIEKLKILLPKTWNIDNSYIKRLVYTDITSLNKAVNKLKSSKNAILREQLLNKITSSTMELDKSVDFFKNMNSHNNRDMSNMNVKENIRSQYNSNNNTNTNNNFSINNHPKNNLYFLNNNSYNVADEYDEKQFYEDYLDLLLRISGNLKLTIEENKKTSESNESITGSFRDTNKNFK